MYERGLSENKWERIVKQIGIGKCTPFIGAGACSTLPKGGELALSLAEKHKYPLDDKYDLLKVSQYIALEDGSYGLKSDIVETLRACEKPDFHTPNEPHALLADLGLPVYITTNYDDFMLSALETRERKVETDFARWSSEIKNGKIKSILRDEEYEPSVENPLVYHLHGYCEVPESLVLTEEDYLDFLIEMSKDTDLLPPVITESLSNTSLLFIGYSLSDWTLRIILRGLMGSMTAKRKYRHIAVQIEPRLEGEASEDEIMVACEYLDRYFDAHLNMEIDVYWGKAEDFVSELRSHWDRYRMVS